MGWTAPRSGAACPGGDVGAPALLQRVCCRQGRSNRESFFGPASRYLEHAVPERSYQAEPPMSWRCDFIIFDKAQTVDRQEDALSDRPGARRGQFFPLTAEIMSKRHSVPP